MCTFSIYFMPLFENIIEKSQDNLFNKKKVMIRFAMSKTWNTSPYTGLAITLFRTFLQKTLTPKENCIDNLSTKMSYQKQPINNYVCSMQVVSK